MSRRRWTVEERVLLTKLFPDTHTKELCTLFNRSYYSIATQADILGLEKSEAFKEKDRQERAERLTESGKVSRFKKGHVSHNKGKPMLDHVKKKISVSWFKTGHEPKNTKTDNYISVRVDKNGTMYQYIRIAKGKWQQLHVYNWLKAGNTIPEGHILRFIDRNTLNADPANLKLITRAENARLNWKPRGEGKKKAEVKQQVKAKKKEAKKVQCVREMQFKKEQREKLRLQRMQQKEKAFAKRILNEEKKPVIKTPDLSNSIAIRINAKTVVYVKPGTDIEKIKKQFGVAA